jgi:hypothetical protein
MSNKPLFERRAMATLARVQEVFKERGAQYGDSWLDCQFLAMKAVARELGAAIHEDTFRALAAAVMVDLKYQRLLGGYKQDSIDDGINYAAFLDGEMQAVKAARANTEDILEGGQS